ncbi:MULTISPECIES: hypothetical protein [Sphingopyxis]|jgi:hypothetical protein|uniref:Uncharacterized protein n=1 Tax=Sphingopyxis terrae subsp. terrae NBRC 15098 TaxID=1219058 RepID=A0A142VVE2_9SPHN|nr:MULTISPECIES: hypothetical protein [Sphingopyxis]AMU93225.1 hypothetical protein AOA14_01240 [Sphingopyxis terrae subsp. terrae NBRC 15098]MCM3420647.1 hypothetical protein [Sphingopyxis alaskensis]MDZ3832994.1 hypothetical protein [Sphingopyxis sp.]BBB09382.1 hypothetical protein SPYCW_2398 [Sphingopyxis sp. EG6]HEV7342740.1 hypothetical protein [Sphingopyxis sp.]
MADARHTLLETMQDLMSNYLVDECPDHVTWEDFDPDIDGLRSTVIDLLDKSLSPTAPADIVTYVVDVDFYSGDDRFATEVFTIDASTPEGAQHRALSLSLDSIYNDPRIPDLSRTAAVKSTDDGAGDPE